MKKNTVWKTILSSFLLISLGGCGSSPKNDSVPPAETPAAEAETEPAETEPAAAESTEFNGKGTTQAAVLVDEAGIKITADELTYNSYAASMDLNFENNTDRTLHFYCGAGLSRWDSTVTVNGYEFTDAGIYKTIKPGETSKDDLYLPNEDLSFFGITDIAEITFRFVIIDKENEEIYLATGPLKITTSSASSYDLKEDTFQKAVKDGRFADSWEADVRSSVTGNFFSQDGVNIIAAVLCSKGQDDFVWFEIENTTDEVKNLRWRQFGLNDLILQKTWTSYVSLDPHSRAAVRASIQGMVSREGCASLGMEDISSAFFQICFVDPEGTPVSEETLVTIPFQDSVILSGREGEELYDNNGIRIVRSGAEDTKDYYYFLLTVFNDTPDTIVVRDSGTALQVNGVKNAINNYSLTIAPGRAGVMKIGLRRTDSMIAMDANNLTPEMIETVETSLKFFKEGDDQLRDKPFDQPDLVMHPGQDS